MFLFYFSVMSFVGDGYQKEREVGEGAGEGAVDGDGNVESGDED